MFGAAAHHSRSTSGFVHASNTRSRGAAKRCDSCRTASCSVFDMRDSFRELALDGLELRLPERAVRLEPLRRVGERTRAQAETVVPPFDRPADHPGLLQELQVLADRRLRDREAAGG